jgi:hypothetical protein
VANRARSWSIGPAGGGRLPTGCPLAATEGQAEADVPCGLYGAGTVEAWSLSMVGLGVCAAPASLLVDLHGGRQATE